ncbi:MAG TPA: hypothetical protein VJ020_08730, partial [Anaerolineales bacterium]|nr:hypothetical protein [Anaerolineales bacterium]
MPTPRGILLLLLAAPIVAAGTWAAPLQWVALAYLIFCFAIFFLDWRLAESVRRFEVARQHDTKLNLGAENPIRLSVVNRSRRPAVFWLRDEPPDAFEIESRLFAGEASPQGVWRGGYHVRPLRRGDYRFGDLNLRWSGPLGLVVRQARVSAAGPVKV